MKKRYVALVVIVALLVMAGAFLFQASTIYPAQVVAKDSSEGIGIAPFTDRIDFGDVPAGLSVGKEITLENEGSSANKVRVYKTGSIANMIIVNPETFTLEPGESQAIDLSLIMPASAQPETMFTGRIIILTLPW